MGLCKSHSRRTQQALSKRTRHQYYAVVFNSGYNLFGLFPDCYSSGLVYQSSWLSPWCGHRVDAFRHRFSAVHSLRSTQHVLCFLRKLFIIGCGLVFLETSANPYVTELGDKATATSRLNFSQSFNGLGCLFATLVVGQFFFGGHFEDNDVVIPYTILGILVLVIALVFSRVNLPEIKHEETEEDKIKGTRIMKLFRHHPMFVFGLFALLAYEVAEISINSYFINFVTGQGWMNDNMASIILTVALGFFMVGRFAGSWLMRRIRAEMMLFVCAAGSVVCMVCVLLNIGKFSMVAIIANYLFEAIMFPTIFSLALDGLGNLKKSAASLLMMTPIGGCGFLLMGIIADSANLVIPFLIPFFGYFVVLLFASELMHKQRETHC